MHSNTNTVSKVHTNTNNEDEENLLKLSEYDHALHLLIVKLEVL